MLPFTLTDSPLRIINTVKKFRPTLKQLKHYFKLQAISLLAVVTKVRSFLGRFITDFFLLDSAKIHCNILQFIP